MDQNTRNKLRLVVTQCRKLLEDAVSQELEGKFSIFVEKKSGKATDNVTVEDEARISHLGDEERAARKDILDHFAHIKARSFKPREALEQLVREVAFTHLNRFCAYKMMEAREVYVGGTKFREAVSRGVNSNGVKFYLADHPEEERLHNTGHHDIAYRHFLDWLGGLLSEEIGVLFNPNDPANRLYPPQKALDEVLVLINDAALADIWVQDETIGWVYQYFTPKELRDQARKESQAPRNSYELAFRNQFFTPRYVVEFLTDNTLGRIWYEMRKGDTKLKDQCRYMVRRPNEVFLAEGRQPPKHGVGGPDDLSQEELLKLPVHVPHRTKKDPREIKVLDPASGSGHFLLYGFDLLVTIYEEAYSDPELGPALRKDYPTLADLQRAVPGLILAHNLHGIDIDLRASQIAALALWLRCQRAYQDLGLKKDRAKITRSNFVCAEPMPGEDQMLKEFVGQLEPKLLGQLVEVVFEKMKLAGEAGSLLKIEEEIRSTVANAKAQWGKGARYDQMLLFGTKRPQPVQTTFDFSGITDTQFFHQAEGKVIEALRDYAEKAHAGDRLQRKLFADDALRGFAFVDLCHKQFDVVLMNPPFGSEVPAARDYIRSRYPKSKHDLCASVIERFLALLSSGGALGAITTRTALFVQTFSHWREDILSRFAFAVVADLGYGVLDAMVETAMYVIRRPLSPEIAVTPFISALSDVDKQKTVECATSQGAGVMTWRSQEAFMHVPGQPMAYWVPEHLLRYFKTHDSFLSRGGLIRVGIQSGDDFRFFRLAWEVAYTSVNTKAPTEDRTFVDTTWLPLAKGGEYSPWWDDIHLLVNWHNAGQEIKLHASARPQNVELFFRPGLTYPYRTTSGFGLRVLPTGTGFSVGGWGVFSPPGYSLQEVMAIYNSRVARYFMEVLLGQGDSSVAGSAARNHGAEAVGGIPFPSQFAGDTLIRDVNSLALAWRQSVADETFSSFVCPALCRGGVKRTLNAAAKDAWGQRCQLWGQIGELSARLDLAVGRAYGISEHERAVIADEEGPHPCDYEMRDLAADGVVEMFTKATDELSALVQDSRGSKRFVVKKAHAIERHVDLICHALRVHPRPVIDALSTLEGAAIPCLLEWTHELVSYCVGAAVGRWDVRLAVSVGAQGDDDPFLPLRVCPRGCLQGPDALPAIATPEGYPLRVGWDGILVDAADHPDDIVRRVQDVFEAIWEQRSEAIEREACSILGVSDLRDYFARCGNGGFWNEHVSRYSKSRRNAPIYWMLQSSKGNYALWLYYHRLDKDVLFKALVNYVEPKNRLETSRLDTVRSQKVAAGESGREAKRLAKEVEQQEELISELRDFEDKLRRAADLHLVPDLNDGVVLNIAPLHELVPWKEAKNYWDELLEGKYEWSSIGKQLREKGLVK